MSGAILALSRAAPADLLALAKPRIVALVVLTVAAGYCLAAVPAPALSPAARALILVHAMLGTAIVAGAAGALNQVAERDVDARMRRTANRPLPTGRLAASEGALFAWTGAIVGTAYLAALVNPATAALAAATFIAYVFVYTPLKRRTSLATLIGAVPGALPIVGGWMAAGGELDAHVLVLFWILFLWQLPHFLALSWIYRDDYARAGLRMLSVDDADGSMTFRQAALSAMALVPISLAPVALGVAGAPYFAGAAALSGWYAWTALAASRDRTARGAKRLFLSSLVYLPGLLLLMIADRLV